MLSTILRTIAEHALFARSDRVIVAVSGGPDSMALLAALWEVHERLGLTLEVAGVDHGLRAAAAAELDLVQARADELGLSFHRVAADVAGERRRGGASLQDAARRARLGVLAALAAERGARRVALGHQADDQAETVLQRIIRGTGLAGLRGIPYQRAPFVRPLLDVRRAEILRYLRRRSIPFVEDPSNADFRFSRARIRHRVMPLLAGENPRIVEALIGLADGARARGDGVGGELASVARRAASVVGRLRERGGTAHIDVAGGRQVVVSYGQVRIASRRGATRSARAVGPVRIEGPGRYPWSPGGRVEVRIDSGSVGRPGDEAFDADRLTWPLVVRARRPGDRMRPRGGRGSRKLSDLMIDAKIVRGARGRLPIVTAGDGEVLFVPGLRPAEVARPTAATARFLRVRFDREAPESVTAGKTIREDV